ncbi:YoaK family protein [Pseudofrankia sp. EUN1h]|uniref:YoaK family protein n=2 Tax=Pseudofrankia TaxID=2994363 RepID=UPI000234CAF9|nr:YoaK family protein [Pseudofrankia sp. EUN1h]
MVRGWRGGRAGGPVAHWPRATAGALLSMTFVSGLVDAVVFLAIGHLFVAMVTGNIMFLGFTLAGAPGHSAAQLATAVTGFFVGAVVGAPPRRSPARPGPTDGAMRTDDADDATWAARRPLALAAAAYAGLLVIGLVIAMVFDAEAGRMRYVMIVVLGLAMGMQNAAGRRLAMPDIPTNVLTTQLTMIAAGGWRTGELGRSARRRSAAPVVMFSGALVGAATYRAGGVPVPLALASALAVVVALEVATGRVRPP